MTVAAALRWYIVLVIIAAFLLVLLLPAEIRLDLGRLNVCRFVGNAAPTCQALYRFPDTIPVTIRRPTLWGRSLEYQYALDIRGGSEVTLVLDMDSISALDREHAHRAAREVIARRIDLYGLSESSVTLARSGDSYRLIAAIPGITQSDNITALIGSTAQLDFREYQPRRGDTPASGSATASPSGLLVTDFVPTDLTGKDLVRSVVITDPLTNKPAISLEFTSDGREKFAQLTARSIGKPLAIFLDEYPISAPRVEGQITDGRAQITGDFTPEQAKSLAASINGGSLPAPISVLSVRTIQASLGASAVRQSVFAALIGLGLMALFLVLIYGLKGALGIVALIAYTLITLVLYKLIPVTLSLAGITGFLLSIGMAVDTIILVYERLREEEAEGGPLGRVIARSFGRAWGSIKDANVVTLITASILANPFDWSFLNSSGMIRGFALTLALGIILNLFTGMFVLRVLLTVFYIPRKTV